MGNIWRDLSYGARMLLKHSGFTFVAALTLALGIGATTAIFSVVNAVVLRPLPYREPERLMWVYRMQPPVSRSPVSAPAFRDFAAQQRVFEPFVAHYAETMILTETDPAERLLGRRVTANFFALFGIEPERGRFFLPVDDAAGASRVAVISHALWLRRFGGEESVIGKTVKLNGEAHTIIGIAPPQFQFSTGDELWTPARLVENQRGRGTNFLMMMGRLKDGVSREQAQAQVNQIAATLAQQYPANHEKLTILVAPLSDEMVRNIRTSLWLLLGAVGCVLLIACANVANLSLARGAARQQEFAVRAALGAGRFTLARQLLTESLLLACFGGALGVLLAVWGAEALVKFAPADLPRAEQISLDRRVLGFTLLVSLLTGLIFGLAPAWQHSIAAKMNLSQMLKEGARGAGGQAGRSWLRRVLVVTEIALSFVLLAGAGLFIGSAQRLAAVHPGFEADNVLTAVVYYPQKPESAYPPGEAGDRAAIAERVAFLRELQQRVATLPGVQSCGGTSGLPLSGDGRGRNAGYWLPEQPARANYPVAEIHFVAPGYFNTLGVPLLRGRDFDWNDTPQMPLRLIINETLAQSVFPNEDPVGKQLVVGGGQPYQIIGVAAAVRQWELALPPPPEVYFSATQLPDGEALSLTVKTSVDPASLGPALWQAVQSVNRDAAVFRVQTMESVISGSLARGRFYTWLMTCFGVAALLLAAVGLYSVVAYAVAQRTREFGLRIALGAQPGHVARMVVQQGMALTLAGIASGVITALGLSSLIEKMLFGISPTEPWLYGGVALLLTGVALLASWIPARRAAKVDPMVALRCE
jgi:putative ABC transport system permease protein